MALSTPPSPLQCKPDPLVLERTQKMLVDFREEANKQGVRRRAAGEGWGLRLLEGLSASELKCSSAEGRTNCHVVTWRRHAPALTVRSA